LILKEQAQTDNPSRLLMALLKWQKHIGTAL